MCRVRKVLRRSQHWPHAGGGWDEGIFRYGEESLVWQCKDDKPKVIPDRQGDIPPAINHVGRRCVDCAER